MIEKRGASDPSLQSCPCFSPVWLRSPRDGSTYADPTRQFPVLSYYSFKARTRLSIFCYISPFQEKSENKEKAKMASESHKVNPGN